MPRPAGVSDLAKKYAAGRSKRKNKGVRTLPAAPPTRYTKGMNKSVHVMPAAPPTRYTKRTSRGVGIKSGGMR